MDAVTIFVTILLLLAITSFLLGPTSSGGHHVTEEMVSQVVSMFPDVDRTSVRRDLQMTGSVEVTIENILAGKVRRNVSHDPSRQASSSGVSGAASAAGSQSRWEALIRNETLQKKRREMVADARKLFLASEEKCKQQASSSGASAGVGTGAGCSSSSAAPPLASA